MNISYTLRSDFTAPCQEGIIDQQKALNAGQAVQIVLEARGYPGKVKVTINTDDLAEFETDWSGDDLTRFPARIKAAATALRDYGYKGSFVISHADGMLSIVKTA